LSNTFLLYFFCFIVGSYSESNSLSEGERTKAISKEFLAPRYSKTYDDGYFREIDFHGRKFYVRSKAEEIINWIVQEKRGEGKVSQAFEDILRIGEAKSKDVSVEHGWCTKAHREANGGKHAIFLDIGANAGFYGMYAAACGCRTYFFDIQEECHDWISSSIDKNKFHHAALIPYPIGNVISVELRNKQYAKLNKCDICVKKNARKFVIASNNLVLNITWTKVHKMR